MLILTTRAGAVFVTCNFRIGGIRFDRVVWPGHRDQLVELGEWGLSAVCPD